MWKYTLGYWYYQLVHQYNRFRELNLLNQLSLDADFTVTTYSKQTADTVIADDKDNSTAQKMSK